jgi:hypothetical protein
MVLEVSKDPSLGISAENAWNFLTASTDMFSGVLTATLMAVGSDYAMS